MSNAKMLIDATHPEETRVVVQRNGRVEEFDFESAARKLLRGNIYLAKVTRVEPSLQAAFVDYGGNRHGFLAFNEIHPDYYQIPVADRQALLDEEAAAEAELEAAADRRAEALARRQSGRPQPRQQASDEPGSFADDGSGADASDASPDASHIVDVEEEDDTIEEIGGEGDDAPQSIAADVIERSDDRISEPAPHDHAHDHDHDHDHDHEGEAHEPVAAGVAEAEVRPSHHHEAEDDEAGEDASDDDENDDESNDDATGETVARDGSTERSSARSSEANEDAGRSDMPEDSRSRPRRRPRNYKIQEVIKRRQVILVQVVKEERGNKGAALTTYLSLAGRYTVLMPNTARGGGISRKITNPQDRKRLKSIAQELEVPEGMGLIIRTAGAARTKQEIKRDFEYLLRLWESVREMTLQSTAPSLVYEEGDLVKRSIRDLYNKDVDEVIVAGDSGYRDASEFMHMLMPSHAKNVVPYKDPTPLFTRYGVERQLAAMFTPQVTLRSGGYIVINQTEALVAIDVNSGKSTREFSIEETALATNLEASDEIARQLKLRDLAGLIVIDFIDMEEKRNNRAVERRLKDALRFDRARIQLGRISHFGLMEMSRQRLRTGVLEGSTSQCQHCQGTGIIRSTESIALAVLRGIEDAITAGGGGALIATTTPGVALYILNSKRAYVMDMEARHGHTITILGSDRIQGANFTVERGAPSAIAVRRPERAAVNMNWGFEGEADGEGEDEAPGFEGAAIEIIEDAGDGEDDSRRERHARDGGREGARDSGREGARDGGRDGGRDSLRGDGDGDGGRRGRRRRRGRGRGRDRDGDTGRGQEVRAEGAAPADWQGRDDDNDAGGDDDNEVIAINGDDSAGAPDERALRGDRSEDDQGDRTGRRRRRGRRGGRRGRERGRNGDSPSANGNGDPLAANDDGIEPIDGEGDQPDISQPPQQRTERPRQDRQNTQRHDRGRRDRLWDVPAAPAESTSDGAAPVSEPVSETVPEAIKTTPQPSAAPAAEQQPQRRRHEADSTEPRIERVVLRPGEEDAGSGDAAAAPQRKGWWQRRFGGE